MNFPPAKQKLLLRTRLKKQVLSLQLLVKSLFKIIVCLLILYNEIFSLTLLRSKSIFSISASVKPKRKFM